MKLFLQRIANLDPTVDSDDINEWADAKCFDLAQKIARDALETHADAKDEDEFVEALKKIARLDPEVESSECNEWAKAECFWMVRKIARKVLDNPFLAAIGAGFVNRCRELLAQGLDPNIPDSAGNTSMHAAALSPLCGTQDASKIVEIIKALMEFGGDINAANHTKVTPLHIATQCGHASICSALLDLGADPNCADQWGLVPLHHAAEHDDLEIARRLIQAGSKIDALDENHQTPLHRAAQNGQEPVCRVLIAAGADPSRTDRDGYLPADLARDESPALSSILLKAALEHRILCSTSGIDLREGTDPDEASLSF